MPRHGHGQNHSKYIKQKRMGVKIITISKFLKQNLLSPEIVQE